MSGELMREKPACTPPPVARTQLSRDAWVGRVVRTLLSLDRPVWERGGGGGGRGLVGGGHSPESSSSSLFRGCLV